MKEIRLLSLFSGVGAFESALQRDGIPFKLVDYCEIDKYASQSYEAVHADLLKDGAKNLVDVRAVDGKEYRGKVDLVTYGFPCFPAITEIKVWDGEKFIDKFINEVKVGDMVLTHKGNTKKVVRTMQRYFDGTMVRLRADDGYGSHPEVYSTDNPPFLCGENWVPACKLEVDDYVRGYAPFAKGGFADWPVTETKHFHAECDVYNLEVEDDHSYVANGFAVHNCQDISLAGKQRGMFNPDGTPTRSGLFFDALRIIHHAQPGMAIAENVKALTSKKFVKQFAMVLDGLNQAGYNSYWKVLNAKDYGIPQNRERVLIVSIRKDLDKGHQMQVDLFGNETPVSQDGGLFPKPVPLKLRLKDLLQPENEVDAKYYLNDKLMGYVRANGLRKENPDIPAEVGEIGNYSRKPFGDTEVIDRNGITQTLRSHATNKSGFAVIGGDRKHATVTDGGHHQFLKIKDETAKGYDEAVDGDGVYIQNIDKKRGTIQTSPDVGVVVEGNYSPTGYGEMPVLDGKGIAPTLRSEAHGNVPAVHISVKEDGDFRLARNDKKSSTVQGFQFVSPENISTALTTTHTPNVFSKSQPELINNEPRVIVEGNYMPSKHNNADIVSVEGIAPTVRENHGTVTGVFSKSQPEVDGKEFGVHDVDAISPALTGGDRRPMPKSLKKTIDNANLEIGEPKALDLYNKKAQEISPALTLPNHNSERIRKLTPRECWRLMGFSDADFDKAKATGMSDTQLYKQAGNSIVVNVLMALFKSIAICDNLTEGGN